MWVWSLGFTQTFCLGSLSLDTEEVRNLSLGAIWSIKELGSHDLAIRYETQTACSKGLRASGPKGFEAMYYSILFYSVLFYVTSLYLRSEISLLLTYKNVRNSICRQAKTTANATELKDKYCLCTNCHMRGKYIFRHYFRTL